MIELIVALLLLIAAGPAGGTYEQAERIQQTPTTWVAGDCDSVEAIFVARGATSEETAFFFGRGIINRETRCGLNTHNESTGDSGICQINPVHNRAGYFWGVSYGDGGWLMYHFGLQTRQYTDSPEWVNACLYLYRKEGTSPWH